MGAEMCDIKPGDVVAVWGADRSASSRSPAPSCSAPRRSSRSTGSRTGSRWRASRAGAETINYEEVDVRRRCSEMTAGRGPDACIDAVGMEAHPRRRVSTLYDRVKQALRMETDRPHALRAGDHVVPQRRHRLGDRRLRRAGRQVPDRRADEPVADDRDRAVPRAPLHASRCSSGSRAARSTRPASSPTACRWPTPRDGYDMFKNKEDDCEKVVLKP